MFATRFEFHICHKQRHEIFTTIYDVRPVYRDDNLVRDSPRLNTINSPILLSNLLSPVQHKSQLTTSSARLLPLLLYSDGQFGLRKSSAIYLPHRGAECVCRTNRVTYFRTCRVIRQQNKWSSWLFVLIIGQYNKSRANVSYQRGT